MPEKPPRDSEVIPLSRWRAALARARTTRRADALLELPDGARVVPTLPVQDLFYAIREIGLADAQELLALASPAQVRGFVDLDAWDRDQLLPERLAAWLEALAELGPERLARALAALDVELPSLFLARQARVYDLTLGEAPPEATTNPLVPTPDRFFLVEITAGGESGALCERLLDLLYRADPDLARRVVMGARWELPAELEEQSYRWRSGRMADLGFVDYYDALEIYRYLDPQSVRVGEGTADPPPPGAADADTAPPGALLPSPYAEPLEEASFLHRALAGIGDAAELLRLQHALVALANRVLAADRVEPADLEGVRASLVRAMQLLSLGLEYVAGGQLPKAVLALQSVAVARLFRAGTSLTLQLGRLARALGRRERAHFEPPWTAFYQALVEPLPRLHPPGEAAARPFREVADVRLGARLLEQAGDQATLVVDRLGFGGAVGSFGDRLRTAAANLALGRPFAPTPLAGAADLFRLRQVAFQGSDAGERLRPGLVEQVLAAVQAAAGAGPPERAAVVRGWLGRLEEELSRVTGPVDPRFVGGLVYRSGPPEG